MLSRGQNLVTNGSGALGNNYNFTSYTFDPVDLPIGARGAFTRSIYNGSALSDELIPVDPNTVYKMKVMIKGSGTYGHKFYAGFASVDVDGFIISHQSAFHIVGSETTLAQDLNPGDTSIVLTDASGWTDQTITSQRYLGVHPFTNNKGYTYPEYTYTRVVYGYHQTNVSKSGNSILIGPSGWSGAAIAAGTKVAQHYSGSGYHYNIASNTVTPAEWTEYSGFINGASTGFGDPSERKLRPGTASIRLLTLHNRDVPGGTTHFTKWVVEKDWEVLKSPDGKAWRLSVDNSGVVSTTLLTA